MSSDPAAGRQIPAEQPFGVIVIAALQFVSAVLGAMVLYEADLSLEYVQETGYADVASLILDLVGIVAAVGLLRLHRWAWVLTMFVLAVDMGFNLWRYWEGTPEYIRMSLNVIAIFYMNSRDVRRAFHYTGDDEEPAVRG